MCVRGTQEMEKRNSYRLTAMERNQAETNRRLGDVMNSNLNLQSLLQSLVNTLSTTDVIPDVNKRVSRITKDTAVSTKKVSRGNPIGGNSEGIESTERWWDRLCKTSVEEENGEGMRRDKEVPIQESKSKVYLNFVVINNLDDKS